MHLDTLTTPEDPTTPKQIQVHDSTVRSFFENHRLVEEILSFILPADVVKAIMCGCVVT